MALKEVGVKLVVDGIGDFKSKMADAGKSVDGIGGAIQKNAKLIRNVGLGIAGAATGVGIAGLKMAADFEGAMREVNTMMGLGQDEFQALSDQVLQTAKDVGKSPEEMAQALYQVISAGIPAGEAMEFLATSARAAIGGVTDTTTAVDGITTVINAFHMEASQAESVASTMFETVKRGKTTFEELSSYMFQVANSAASLDIEFSTVSAALATMTKQGIPTAQATTQLRQVMVALTKPTEEMKKALNKLGYESGKALIKEKGLQKGLELLRKETGGNDEQLGKMLGSVEALNAMFALTGENSAMFTEDLEAITQASEDATASTEAYNEMNESTARQFEQLMTTIKVLAIEIGEALMPALIAIIDAVKPILEKVANWISENPKLTAVIVALGAALGAMMVVIGTIAPAITTIVAAIGSPLLVPIAAVVAAIVGIGVAVVALIKHWDDVVAVAKWVWEKIKEYFQKAWDFVKEWGVYFLGVPGLIIKHWDAIYGFFKGIWDKVYSIFTGFRDNIKKWFVDKITGFVDTIKSVWEGLTGFFSKLWNDIVAAAKLPLNTIIGMINKVLGYLSGKHLFSIKIPSWVPSIGGKGFSLDLPKIRSIPTLAAGGNIIAGGSAIVGERGPELLNLPTGASVQPLTNNYNYEITENYARPESPQSLDLSLQALAMYART